MLGNILGSSIPSITLGSTSYFNNSPTIREFN